MVKTEYEISGRQVSYDILEDGYEIYLGNNENPWIRQTGQYATPMISGGTFEENAIAQIEDIINSQNAMMNETSANTFNPDICSLEELKEYKKEAIGVVCTDTIYKGIDVETTNGTEHFSLTEFDQLEIEKQADKIKDGAETVYYHADGELERSFTASEFTGVKDAAYDFIKYNRTLCNHINIWIKRCTTKEQVYAIEYTSALPEDLQENFDSIIGVSEEN